MAGSVFDGKHKMYFNEDEVPLVIRKDKWLWDKFDFDIQKFEVVTDEEDDV